MLRRAVGNNNTKVFNLINGHFSLRKQTIKEACDQFINTQNKAIKEEGKIMLSSCLFILLFKCIMFWQEVTVAESDVTVTESQEFNAMNRLEFTCLPNESSPTNDKSGDSLNEHNSSSSFQGNQSDLQVLDLSGNFFRNV